MNLNEAFEKLVKFAPDGGIIYSVDDEDGI